MPAQSWSIPRRPGFPAHQAQDSLPAEEIELRAFGNGQYYGRFMMTPMPDTRPPLPARLAAVTLAELAGYALGATAPVSDTG